MRRLYDRLCVLMHRELPFDHVHRESSALVEKFTLLLSSYAKLRIDSAAYACLKAITLLHPGSLTRFCAEYKRNSLQGEVSMAPRVSLIQDQFVKALQIHLSQQEYGARLTDILTWLPMLHSAAR